MNQIGEFIAEIDRSWEPLRQERQPLRIIGCGALMLQTDYERGTKDSDVLQAADFKPRDNYTAGALHQLILKGPDNQQYVVERRTRGTVLDEQVNQEGIVVWYEGLDSAGNPKKIPSLFVDRDRCGSVLCTRGNECADSDGVPTCKPVTDRAVFTVLPTANVFRIDVDTSRGRVGTIPTNVTFRLRWANNADAGLTLRFSPVREDGTQEVIYTRVSAI